MLAEVAGQFRKVSDQMPNYIQADNFQAAKSLQKAVATDLRKYQDRLLLAFGQMYELKRSFIAVAI